MSYEYDRSFAPFVIPAGRLFGRNDFPDLPWFVLMMRGQLRSVAGEVFVRILHRLPLAFLRSPTGQRLEAWMQQWVPEVPGRIQTMGDAEFAYQRFAGVNPLTIMRVKTLEDIPQKLRISDALFAQIVGEGQTLAERVARGDIFVQRSDVLKVQSSQDLQPGKFVAPASVLFCHAPERETRFAVVPVAIECALSSPEGDTGVFTPLSEQDWRAAKRLAAVADIHMSELCLHLARAHYMTVPFAIAMRRTLPAQHPLYQFLMPHLRFNMFVDRFAWLQGVRDTSGILIRSLAGSARWSQNVARSVYQQFSFREQHFERDLVARGMDAHVVDYPYRDDGRLLWQAIARFANGYVSHVYADDQAVLADIALQAWIADVSSSDGGNVRGLLQGERLDTRAELAEILTQILFVAGPLHALAHYASAAHLQHVDANPSFLMFNPLDARADSAPGRLRAMYQYTRVTSTYCQRDRLGDFSRYPLGRNAEVQPLIAAFQADLQVIEQTINKRNAQRFAPFIHFLPSRISNGITV